MAFRVDKNTTGGRCTVVITSNSTITVAGNSSVSDLAEGDEVLTGASITQVWYGSPSGNNTYWEVARGANTILTLDSTGYNDYAGCGAPIKIDSTATVVATLYNNTVGAMIIEFRKEGSQIVPGQPS